MSRIAKYTDVFSEIKCKIAGMWTWSLTLSAYNEENWYQNIWIRHLIKAHSPISITPNTKSERMYWWIDRWKSGIATKQFSRYVSQLRKTSTHLITPWNKWNSWYAQAFSKHFKSVYSNSWPKTFAFVNQSMEVLSLAPLFQSRKLHWFKRLRATKSVGLDGVLIIINGCSEILCLFSSLIAILAYLKILFSICKSKQLLFLL
jgi:hypothetical protein